MRTPLRVAGWGTLGFAIAFFATFVANAAVYTAVPYPEHMLPQEMAQDVWGGTFFVPLWSAAGAALVVAAIGLPALVFAERSLGRQTATAFGIIAAGGWIFSGAAALAQRTHLLNDNIAGTGADPSTQRAVVEGLYVLVHTGAVVFGIAALPWLAIVAVRSSGRLPKTVTVLLWIAAVATFAGYLVTGTQLGFLVVLPCFAAIGAILLVRARRLPRDQADGQPAHSEASAATA